MPANIQCGTWKSRGYVCLECEWCVEYDRATLRQAEIDRANRIADDARKASVPYVGHHYCIGLIESYGSPRAALAAMVADVDGSRDLARSCAIDLIAWGTPSGECMGKWHEFIAEAEEMFPELKS